MRFSILEEMGKTCSIHCGKSEVHIGILVRRLNGSVLFGDRNNIVTYLGDLRDSEAGFWIR
jgi:hypothetical protein